MESLEKHVQALLEIIEKEYGQYKRIFELVKQEQSVLVNADISGLEKNMREQQTFLSGINKLEEKRLQELEVIGIYLGTVPEQLKFAAIADNVPGDLSQAIIELERNFKSVIQEILKINKSNNFLINRSLQFIDKNVQAFFGAMEDKGVYSPDTSTAKAVSKTKNMVDWKA